MTNLILDHPIKMFIAGVLLAMFLVFITIDLIKNTCYFMIPLFASIVFFLVTGVAFFYHEDKYTIDKFKIVQSNNKYYFRLKKEGEEKDKNLYDVNLESEVAQIAGFTHIYSTNMWDGVGCGCSRNSWEPIYHEKTYTPKEVETK